VAGVVREAERHDKTDVDNSKKRPSNKPASAYVFFLRHVQPRLDVGAR
jgi:hypothetical protein